MSRKVKNNGTGINPHDWQNLSLNDLTQINRDTQERLRQQPGYSNETVDPLLEFFALNSYWTDPLCPGIPDGR